MLTRLKANSEGKLAKQICRVVLDQFDKQYSKELGDSWNTVRDVLISPSLWQYAILFNRFNYPVELEKDLELRGYHTILQGSLPYYPKSMKCYLSRTPDRMPSERHQTGNLKKYYLLNAASLLPVLALELNDGERVLDLCAAPGGKSVALLQCAYPGYLLCNEYDGLRMRWLRQTLESFIPQSLTNIIKVSELDGREMGDAQPETFDKVLVDAPCSNDRSWLFSSDSQKAAYRIHQRNNLPILQVELLRHFNSYHHIQLYHPHTRGSITTVRLYQKCLPSCHPKHVESLLLGPCFDIGWLYTEKGLHPTSLCYLPHPTLPGAVH